jgi:hypothetical protein
MKPMGWFYRNKSLAAIEDNIKLSQEEHKIRKKHHHKRHIGMYLLVFLIAALIQFILIWTLDYMTRQEMKYRREPLNESFNAAPNQLSRTTPTA